MSPSADLRIERMPETLGHIRAIVYHWRLLTRGASQSTADTVASSRHLCAAISEQGRGRS